MTTGKRTYPAGRKSRKGYVARHPNGELTRVPNGGARNTKSVQIRVKHAGSAKLEHARLDRRTWAGKIYVSTVKDLVTHMGGEPSFAQQLFIDQAARLRIASDIAWGAAKREGLDKESAAFNNFIRSSKSQREILHALGLERQARPVTLNDYIESRVAHESA